MEVFINGQSVASLTGWTPTYITHPLELQAAKVLHAGTNSIAVHCRQFSAGQHVDVGLLQTSSELEPSPVMQTAMLIRRPSDEVFEAFANPEITSKFWFTKGSSRLKPGGTVQWDWEMYGVSVPVTVKAVDLNQRIVIEWPGADGPRTVEWKFSPQRDQSTFVSIRESGFTGETGELIRQIADSTQGFTLVLAGLKALLEHNIRLNLVADRFPAGLTEHHG